MAGKDNKQEVKEVQVAEVKDAKVVEETKVDVTTSAEYKELLAKYEESEKDKAELTKQLEESKVLVDKQAVEIKKLKEAPKQDAVSEKVAEVSLPKPKLIKVKFLEAHTFYFANRNIEAVKGSEHEVDTNIANKLVARGLAVILS